MDRVPQLHSTWSIATLQVARHKILTSASLPLRYACEHSQSAEYNMSYWRMSFGMSMNKDHKAHNRSTSSGSVVHISVNRVTSLIGSLDSAKPNTN